jgi:hypothetical protein
MVFFPATSTRPNRFAYGSYQKWWHFSETTWTGYKNSFLLCPLCTMMFVVDRHNVMRYIRKIIPRVCKMFRYHLVDPDFDRRCTGEFWNKIISLTGIRLWAQICAHLNLELRKCLITFPIFVPSQRLIARNVRELFSFNRGISHLNNACRIDDVSRGSLSCYKILTNKAIGLPKVS